MNIFFHAQYTELRKDADLISLALVTGDGIEEKSFYAEFTDYNLNNCNSKEWIQENVINKLKLQDKPEGYECTHQANWKVKGNKEFVKKNIIDFINNEVIPELQNEETITFVGDCCSYDFVLLQDLLYNDVIEDASDKISQVPVDLNQMIMQVYNLSSKDAFDKSRDEIIKEADIEETYGLRYALDDARKIKECYKYLDIEITLSYLS